MMFFNILVLPRYAPEESDVRGKFFVLLKKKNTVFIVIPVGEFQRGRGLKPLSLTSRVRVCRILWGTYTTGPHVSIEFRLNNNHNIIRYCHTRV